MGAWHEALKRQDQAHQGSAHLLTALLAAGLAVVASRLVTKMSQSRRRSQAAARTTAAATAADGEDEVTASAKLIAGACSSGAFCSQLQFSLLKLSWLADPATLGGGNREPPHDACA